MDATPADVRCQDIPFQEASHSGRSTDIDVTVHDVWNQFPQMFGRHDALTLWRGVVTDHVVDCQTWLSRELI